MCLVYDKECVEIHLLIQPRLGVPPPSIGRILPRTPVPPGKPHVRIAKQLHDLSSHMPSSEQLGCTQRNRYCGQGKSVVRSIHSTIIFERDVRRSSIRRSGHLICNKDHLRRIQRTTKSRHPTNQIVLLDFVIEVLLVTFEGQTQIEKDCFHVVMVQRSTKF